MIGPRSDGTLKKDFREKSVTHFCLNVATKFSVITNKAIKYLLAFYQAGFSVLLDLKSK
jgi:hypothetical protein